MPSGGAGATTAVDFPPRNEPFAFRQSLEAKYRDGLRRGATSTFVDLEGDIVWIQEYLRYRVSSCGHSDAETKVFAQIDGRGVQPACSTTSTAPFPPRNEPFVFRQDLEVKYRDGLRRGATSTFVDIEGDIVWIQEYLRYRVSACGHSSAETKVFMQIDGRGVQPDCASSFDGTWSSPQGSGSILSFSGVQFVVVNNVITQFTVSIRFLSTTPCSYTTAANVAIPTNGSFALAFQSSGVSTNITGTLSSPTQGSGTTSTINLTNVACGSGVANATISASPFTLTKAGA